MCKNTDEADVRARIWTDTVVSNLEAEAQMIESRKEKAILQLQSMFAGLGIILEI